MVDGKKAFDASNYKEAQHRYEEALALFEQLNDNTGICESAYFLGRTYLRLSKYDQAIKLLEKALQIYREFGSKKRIADALNYIGEAYRSTADFDKAIINSEASLKIDEELGSKAGVVSNLNNIAIVHYYQGNFGPALDYFRRTAKILAEMGDKKGLVATFNNIANVYVHQGSYSQALESYREAMKLQEQVGLDKEIAETLSNIGAVYRHLSNYTEAMRYSKDALTRFEERGDQKGVAASLNNIGVVYEKLGAFEKALEYHQKSLKTKEQIGDKLGAGNSLDNIGLVYRYLGDYKRALVYAEKSLKRREEIGDKMGKATSLDNIGLVYQVLGDYRLAMESHQKSLAANKEIGARSGQAFSLSCLGLVHYKMKNLAAAEQTLSEAIQISKEISNSEVLRVSLHTKGLALKDLNRPKEAIDSMKEAIAVIEGVRGGLQLSEEKALFLTNRLEVYESLIQLLVEQNQPQDAFAYAERAKARAFLDLLAEAKIDPVDELQPELRDRKAALQVNLTRLQRKLRREIEKKHPDRQIIQRLGAELEELDEEYARLWKEIRRLNVHYADLHYPEPLKLEQAQELLDQHTVLLEYSVGKGGCYLFAITKNASHVYRLADENYLVAQIQELRRAALKPEPIWEATENAHRRFKESAHNLYSSLIKPAELILAGKRRILIVPDGSLNYLPFELLIKRSSAQETLDFKKLTYLVHDYEVYYVPSATVLATLRNGIGDAASKMQKDFLAFADSTLKPEGFEVRGHDLAESETRGKEARQAEALRPLAYARKEVEAIASLFPKEKVKLFVGREASESNLKHEKLDEYRMVHFATHAVLNEVRPQLSALVLNPGNESEEDGYLTMREIFDLKLKTALVALSACSTGLGQNSKGEGISGIARAFIYAGTQSVLVSLWNVYDQSTAELMSTFYRKLVIEKMDRTTALRQAKLEMIKSGKYSHPYYWAPFVLIGDN